ncbi:MAG TPA: hypothetical protein VHT29_07475 [Solirubrobacteraceae bacterium]|jgi:hypothetical protein|nr:hypothetical protein [Solirubrobacteraceae bacterium]
MATSENTETLLKAILTLMIDQRDARPGPDPARRTELLLADAGLAPSEIAELTGKQASAVRMTLSRARRAPKKRSDA